MTLEADEAVQEARFAGACQDQHAGRPAPGLAKRKQSCNKPKQVSFPYQGYGLGPGFLGAWGPGLGAGASRGGLGGRAFQVWEPPSFFVVLKKNPGGRQAKGWETVETAAAEVGAWREAGTGYPPYPPPAPCC